MLRVAVIGANGQLGRCIVRTFERSSAVCVVPLTRAEIDVTRRESVNAALSAIECDVVINTAAAHGRDAETALEHTFAVNALGPKFLADYCWKHSLELVHISTDYVFSGDRRQPYQEGDPCQPLNAYGSSKLAGEYLVRSAMDRWYLVRVSGLYGLGGCRAKANSNFVEMVLEKAQRGDRLDIVDDQWVTPTYVVDVAEGLLALLQTHQYNVYHMTNAGSCSWYEFASEIVRQTGLTAAVHPIKTAVTAAPVSRPAYSVLDNHNMRALGLPEFRYWSDALSAYLSERTVY